MNTILIVTYVIFLLIMYYIFNNLIKKNDDVFNPTSFFILFTLLEVPYLFKVIDDHSLIPYYALINIVDFDAVFSLHIFNSILFVSTVMISLVVFKPKAKLLTSIYTLKELNKSSLLMAHVLLFLLGIISYVLFLNSIGGIYYLLQNLDSKSSIIQGTGYYQAIYSVSIFISVGVLINFLSRFENISLMQKIYLIVMVIAGFLILASIGSRKTPMLYIIYTAVMWNYNIKKLQVISVKNVVLIFLGLFYFAMMPLFRVEGAMEYYMNNIPELLDKSLSSLLGFFDRFSDIDRSLLIYSLFDETNLWLGSSFKDLIYAPIPRGIYPDKPPMDTGVYIYNLAHGNNVSPTTSLLEMLPVGWPVSTITNMYLNFWFPGVVLGGVLYGYVLSYFSVLTKNVYFNAISLYLYASIIFGDFAITNIKLVSFLTKIVFSYLIVKSIFMIVRLRINKNR